MVCLEVVCKIWLLYNNPFLTYLGFRVAQWSLHEPICLVTITKLTYMGRNWLRKLPEVQKYYWFDMVKIVLFGQKSELAHTVVN